MAPGNRAALKSEETDLRDRQAGLKQSAADKTAERDQYLKNGLKRLAEKDLLGYAGLASQLGIAMACLLYTSCRTLCESSRDGQPFPKPHRRPGRRSSP